MYKDIEKKRAWQRRYARKHPDRIIVSQRKYRQNHREKVFEDKRKWVKATKVEVLTHYGAGEAACVKCSERRLPCLTIDHIDGRGHEHTKGIGVQRGHNFYRWLKRNEYPEGYQTLCMNCQFVKREENREYGGFLKVRKVASQQPKY